MWLFDQILYLRLSHTAGSANTRHTVIFKHFSNISYPVHRNSRGEKYLQQILKGFLAKLANTYSHVHIHTDIGIHIRKYQQDFCLLKGYKANSLKLWQNRILQVE